MSSCWLEALFPKPPSANVSASSCRERDSNPHSHFWPRDFKSLVSTNSTIAATLTDCLTF